MKVEVQAPWAVPADVTETDTSTFTSPQTAQLTKCLLAASDVLFKLSGRRWSGAGTDVVRPLPRILARDHGRPVGGGWAWWGSVGYFPGQWLYGGYSRWGWVTTNADELPDGSTVPQVTLGRYPVTSVTGVLIDGATVDPATYAVDEQRWLVRLADPVTRINPGWPVAQRIDLPSTSPGTWQVTFGFGVAPPTMGNLAAAELGYQLYLATTPAATGQCRLPARVTQITREGMSAVVLDPQIFLKDGRTGLTICDYFLMEENPGKLRRRATIWTPDKGRRVRRTAR